MSAFEDAMPLIFVGVVLAACIGGMVWIDRSERSELATFHEKCLAIPKTEAECQLLLSLKRTADSAAINSGFAIGFAAGSSAGR